MAQRKGKPNAIHSTLYTNLCYLMSAVPPSPKLKELVTEDMFVHNNSNMQGFLEVIHYLFNIWDEAACKDKFKYCWPVLDQKQKSQFQRATCLMMQEIKQNYPEAQFPNISLALFLQPGGDRFAALVLKLSVFVVSQYLARDSTLMELPMSCTKNKESVKQVLNAKCQPELIKSIKLHSASVSAIKITKKNAEKYVTALEVLGEEKNNVTSSLKEVLVASNVEEKVIASILDPSDSEAFRAWKRRVQDKHDYALQIMENLKGPTVNMHHCHESAAALLTSSDKQSIDGNILKPAITEDLCKRLATSHENLTISLLSNEQLKLQGLVEIGRCAIKTLIAQWSQQDISSAESATEKLCCLVEQSEKKVEDVHHIEGNLKAMCNTLDKSLKKVYEHLHASAEDNKLTKTYKPHEVTNASALLSQIPCTPPWQLRSGTEKGSGSPFLIKKPDAKDDELEVEVEKLLKQFRGIQTSSEENSCSLNLPSNLRLPINFKRYSPASPKRSHSPVSDIRYSVNQLLQSEAPPPCKDLRLSAIRTKSHGARFTASYKQAMHHRLMQLPSKTNMILPKDQSSPIHNVSVADTYPTEPQTNNVSSPKFVKQELNVSNLQLEGASLKDSGMLTMTSANLSSQSAYLNSSSECEFLGDMSLQEIAEHCLSLHSSPAQSPLSYSPKSLSFQYTTSPTLLSLRTRGSPNLLLGRNDSISRVLSMNCVQQSKMSPLVSTPITRPLLSPPAAGATPVSQDEDVKPSLTTLMQRLQAIKSTMKQPALITHNSAMLTPSQHKRPFIKLEIESPP